MARFKYQNTAKDKNSNVLPGASVSVYLAGTTTFASIYTASSGGTAVNQVVADNSGYFYFWVDTDGYAISQKFKIIIVKEGFTANTYDDLVILKTIENSTPVSSTATGSVGEIRWDSDYIYVCPTPNTWKRLAVSAW